MQGFRKPFAQTDHNPELAEWRRKKFETVTRRGILPLTLLATCLSASGTPIETGLWPQAALEIRRPIIAAPPAPAIDNPPFLTPRGAGFDGVGALIIERPDGTFLCSGSLITSRDILTAAHCLTDEMGNPLPSEITAVFLPPPSGSLTYETSSYFVHPDFASEPLDPFDIALVRLAEAADNRLDRYRIYSGPPTTNPATFVGFGQRGEGMTGAVLPPGLRRRGFNQFEVLTDGGILWSDFDSGSPANDAFCFVFRVCQPGTSGLGLGAFESNTAPGDSGGPAFLNDRIVGVLSFGATAGSDFGDIDDELNSTFGEFSGHIYTGFHESWIQTHIIPEPGASVLVCGALGALGLARHSRRMRSRRR